MPLENLVWRSKIRNDDGILCDDFSQWKDISKEFHESLESVKSSIHALSH